MTILNKKRQISFFLFLILVIQLSGSESSAEIRKEIQKVSINPAKVITSGIAIKPIGFPHDSSPKGQPEIVFKDFTTNILHVFSTRLMNPPGIFSTHLINLYPFPFNRVLRI
jgi:hypothetical protein